MTDHGSEDEIASAVGLFGSLPAPVYLALGNHDLAGRDSFAAWQAQAGSWFAGSAEAFGLVFGHAGVFVLNHDWHDCQVPFHWDTRLSQRPVILDSQRQQLDVFLTQTPLPVLLMTHAPLHPVPAAQTGLDEDIHRPCGGFVSEMAALARRHPNLVLALSGHNHVNTIFRHNGLVSISTASFIEPSFDVRVITVNDATISVETISFVDDLGTACRFDAARAWTVGSDSDRRHTLSVS